MITDINSILKKLNLDKNGVYDDHFYVINLEDSNDYARMYTLLDKNAINTEYPQFGVNTNKTTTNITNYFELELNSDIYEIFLIADFKKDIYKIKIKEKDN